MGATRLRKAEMFCYVTVKQNISNRQKTPQGREYVEMPLSQFRARFERRIGNDPRTYRRFTKLMEKEGLVIFNKGKAYVFEPISPSMSLKEEFKLIKNVEKKRKKKKVP